MTNLREVSMQMELPQENIEIMDDIFRAMFMEVFMLNVPRSMNILLHVLASVTSALYFPSGHSMVACIDKLDASLTHTKEP